MSNEFKKLAEVDVLDELSENAHVIVEDGGVTRRYTASGIGGSVSATIFTKDYDSEAGEYVCTCNKTYEQCVDDYNNGNLIVFVKGVLSSGYHAALTLEYQGYTGYAGPMFYRFWDPSYQAQAMVYYYADGTIEINETSNGGE